MALKRNLAFIRSIKKRIYLRSHSKWFTNEDSRLYQSLSEDESCRVNIKKMTNINSAVYEAIESYGVIKTSKVSMVANNDRYAHPPFFRFRFEKEKEEIYAMIKTNISHFQGKLSWDMLSKDDSGNRVIIPIVFAKYLSVEFYNKELYIKEFTEPEYKKLIDDAIDDIPGLAVKIKAGN